MSRLQLALNVSDLDASVAFYSKLFGQGPAKRREGYANFAIVDPPLKLVLIEHAERMAGGVSALNHLGIEAMSREELRSTAERIAATNIEVSAEEEQVCCFALQDKVWVADPDAEPWEVYTVLEDAPEMHGGVDGCCASADSQSIDLSGVSASASVGCC